MTNSISRFVVAACLMLQVNAGLAAAAVISDSDFGRNVANAKSLVSRGKTKEAIMIMEQMREAKGGRNGLFEYEMAKIYMGSNQLADAEREISKGIKLNPELKELYLQMVFLNQRQKKWKEAQLWAQTMIDKFPSWYGGYQANAMILYRTDENERALQFVKEALKREETADSFYLMSAIYFELRDADRAVRSMEAAINMDSTLLGDREGMFRIAMALTHLGRYDDALNAVDLLEQNNPKISVDELTALRNGIRSSRKNGESQRE